MQRLLTAVGTDCRQLDTEHIVDIFAQMPVLMLMLITLLNDGEHAVADRRRQFIFRAYAGMIPLRQQQHSGEHLNPMPASSPRCMQAPSFPWAMIA